jgi:hypothetical protein
VFVCDVQNPTHLGRRLLECLQAPQRVVPHPNDWKTFEPVHVSLPGGRNWKSFERIAKFVSVQMETDKVTFAPHRREGAGFVTWRGDKILESGTTEKEVGETLLIAFDYCQ